MVQFNVVGFVGRDGSDTRRIAKLKADAVPRIGETIKLYGRPFGDEVYGHGDRQRINGEPLRSESLFTVIDVIYGAHTDSDRDEVECDIEVHVDTAQIARPTIKLWCVCDHDPPMRSVRDVETCDDCGDKLPPKGD